MTRQVPYVTVLLVLLAATAFAATPAPFAVCPQQTSGHTSDQPPDPVVVCQQIFPAPPYVHVPGDTHTPDGHVTMTGVVDLDVDIRNHVSAARFYDHNLKEYALETAAGKPLDETSELMKKNHLPSNRVHFLVYEATGKVSGNAFALTALRPAILVTGQAIDSRFLGAWEGMVSKRRSENQWYADDRQPQNFAKIRIVFAPPLAKMDNMGELGPTPILPDGTRFKATGKFENASTSVRLSTGECAPALTSYGAASPFPSRIPVADYFIQMWRFPAMHSKYSKDFHIVFDYPPGLHPAARAMAQNAHNFRLKDFIAASTHPEELRFGIHANPVDQIVFVLKPVTGGGGACK